jgi:sorting nexin-29
MMRMEIPTKIIRLVQMTMDNASAKVKVGNKLSEPFQFNDGLKQGDRLSTTLFNIALHSAINTINQKGTRFLKSSQICAYADDLVIVSRDVNTLKQIHLELEREIQSTVLSVKEKKTKYMIVSTSEVRRRPQSLLVGEKNVDGVTSFTYLGALTNNRNNMSQSVRQRIQARNWAYYANLNLLKNKLISRNMKFKIYTT